MADKHIDLGYHPRAWQAICHADRSRFRVIVLHRRAGKTVLATMELLDAALKFDKELGLFLYIAPFLAQAKNIAWGMLKHRISPLIQSGGATVNESELTIEFQHNGAKIKLAGGDHPDGLRGIRVDGAVIDEVAQTKSELWADVVQPALSDRKGWVIFVGTVNGVNLFSELYAKAKSGSPGWSGHLFTVYQTGAIDADEVARLKADMSPTSFAREYMNDFGASGDDQLMSVEEIEDACRVVYKPGENDYAPRIIGVDPARFGGDASAIIKRQGLQMYDPISFNGMDNMALADQVAYHISSWQPDAVFIDAGAGSGVIDRLRQMSHTVIEVNFGGKPSNPRYKNKKAEMCFSLKEWVASGGAIPNHMRLKQDMATPCYWYDTAGKICIEDKAAIKARGLPSTDYLDAAILTVANPVAKKGRVIEGPAPIVKPYDPFDRERLRNPTGYNPLGRGR